MIHLYSDIQNKSLDPTDFIVFTDTFDITHKIPIQDFNYLQIWITSISRGTHARRRYAQFLLRISHKPFTNPQKFPSCVHTFFHYMMRDLSLQNVLDTKHKFVKWIIKARHRASLFKPAIYEKTFGHRRLYCYSPQIKNTKNA